MYGGCTGDVRGMYGDVRLDIVQIPYGYRTDITEPLPLATKHPIAQTPDLPANHAANELELGKLDVQV